MKVGLVVEGGGMKCAYSAAILDRFLDDNITFDYCIGVSAGSANLVSYLAKQRGRNKRFYTIHPKDKRYFGLYSLITTGNLFNLEFIYSTLTNSTGQDFLDYETLMENPTEYELVTTNAKTGRPEYFSKNNLMKDNYIHIKASSAIPAICKPIKINHSYYFDGGVSDSLPISRAFYQGCDKVVVITSKTRSFIKKPEKHKFLYSSICHKYPEIIYDLDHRHEMYNRESKDMYGLEKYGKCFVIAPSKSIVSSTYSMDTRANEEMYELGLKDYDAIKEHLIKYITTDF